MTDHDKDVSAGQNEKLRHEGNTIDQRQQQIDPAGKHREKPDEPGPHRSQKQPGQDMTEAPQDE